MNAFFIACVIALFALVPAPALQTALATAASTLFESTPFILAGALLAGVMPRQAARAVALLGCGCTGGPSARSIPVTAATALVFGPVVALARFGAAWLLGSRHRGIAQPAAFGPELHALLPAALIAAAILPELPLLAALHIAPVALILMAVAAGLIAAPCGFGSLAIAAVVRTASPAAALAVLCTSGIAPVRVRFFQARCGLERHDFLAYAASALACACVALQHGAGLLNPHFTVALWLCAAALAVLALHFRSARAPHLRWAPLLMLAGIFGHAPPPAYYATETTLAQAFAGEPLDFRGALAVSGEREALVRYAITCCRADAQPVSVELERPLHARPGTWLHARGTLVQHDSRFLLRVVRYEVIAPPHDPYVYR